MLKKTNAQYAIEFVILIAFLFLLFVGFISVITSRFLEVKEENKEKIAEEIAIMVRNEIELAESSADGYTRDFKIPSTYDGNKYSIKILDNRELIVTYIDKDYLLYLPAKICGDVFIPDNGISKENGVVCVNSNFNLKQCQNAASLGLCDGIEAVLPGTKCCCCQRYSLCCPECNNNLDDEVAPAVPDGLIDFPDDPQCANINDNNETV